MRLRPCFFFVLLAVSAALVFTAPTTLESTPGVVKKTKWRSEGTGMLKTAMRKTKTSKIKLPKSKSSGDEEVEEEEEADTVDQLSDETEDLIDEGEDAASEAEEALNEAKEEAEDFFACFPASATVVAPGGLQVRMEDLAVGDSVTVGEQLSQVFMFTHSDPKGMYSFVELTTLSGHALSLSGGHFLYVDGLLKRADAVSVGETLLLSDGARSPVVNVRWIRERGLYNPQTLHGDIAVNGVVASTYTAAVEPKIAHALLAPARVAFKWLGYSSTYFSNGVPEALGDLLLPIGTLP